MLWKLLARAIAAILVVVFATTEHRSKCKTNKKDMTEIKSYGKPPTLVEKVMETVMILRGSDPNWAEAKKLLGM